MKQWIHRCADNGWMDHICPVCGFTENTDIHVQLDWNYCPNCGTRMSKLMDYPPERKGVFDSSSVYFERDHNYNFIFVSQVLHTIACVWATKTQGSVITIAEVLNALGIKADTQDYLFGWIKGRSFKPVYSVENSEECISITLSHYDYIPECVEDANEEKAAEKEYIKSDIKATEEACNRMHR